MGWSLKDMPSQAGRAALVTGTGGLGYESALALASAGASVVIAGRNRDKGDEAVDHILRQHPGADISFGQLDLADLASAAAFAQAYAAGHDRLDLLMNNAGVMTPPTRQTTKDGFEIQFGTNYLGHFALTAHLMPLLRRGHAPRVVSVSSGAHHTGAIQFDDLQWQRRYRPWLAYSQSKLAMLMFALELQRRSDAGGWGVMSNAAHPGYARTELIANGPGAPKGPLALLSSAFASFASQTPAEGALPQLFAATAPGAERGGYYGPDRIFELVGAPAPARTAGQAKDKAVAAKLWAVSETLTGVSFPAG